MAAAVRFFKMKSPGNGLQFRRHLKMVRMINFMLRVFYHSLKINKTLRYFWAMLMLRAIYLRWKIDHRNF